LVVARTTYLFLKHTVRSRSGASCPRSACLRPAVRHVRCMYEQRLGKQNMNSALFSTVPARAVIRTVNYSNNKINRNRSKNFVIILIIFCGFFVPFFEVF
jgi:hypothetical protein